MNKELFERVLEYRTAMAIVFDLFKKGIISEKEYDRINTIMTNKYGLNSCTIFS